MFHIHYFLIVYIIKKNGFSAIYFTLFDFSILIYKNKNNMDIIYDDKLIKKINEFYGNIGNYKNKEQ